MLVGSVSSRNWGTSQTIHICWAYCKPFVRKKEGENAKKMKIESEDLTIYYDMQCPYIYQKIEMVKQYCDTNNVPVSLIQVDTLQKAKDLPCVFNNWGVFYKGNFETVNLLLDVEHLKRILKK